MVSILFLALVGKAPSLEQVYKQVSKLKGVEIKAEMVRPSTIPMEFKIARGGAFFAKYPTSESYQTQTGQTTWMPDRREFSKSKPEEGNPLPAGFEILWPNGTLLSSNGNPSMGSFGGKPAVQIPCKASAGHTLILYVNPKSLMPMGTVAKAGTTEYETRYISVKEVALKPKDLVFVAPADAKAFSGTRPDSKIIKAGALLPAYKGFDLGGKPISSENLASDSRGLVLNFWFSACTGCVQEMPVFAKLANPLRSQGITLIGVNPIDKPKNAQRTAETNRLDFPTLTGPGAKTLADAVGVIAYPVTVVVDSKGIVVDAIVGFDESRLMKALQTIGYKPQS